MIEDFIATKKITYIFLYDVFAGLPLADYPENVSQGPTDVYTNSSTARSRLENPDIHVTVHIHARPDLLHLIQHQLGLVHQRLFRFQGTTLEMIPHVHASK